LGEDTVFRAFARRLSGAAAGPDRDDAARELLARFATRLVALARRQVSPRLQSKVAPEDVVQSVMRTFFRRLDAGEVELRGWAALWGFLALATVRKCQKNAARYGTEARDVSREVTLRVDAGDGEAWEVSVPDREPTPAEAAAFAEELERLLAGLDERDRRAVELLLDGQSVAAVADRVGCSERTVQRTLELVRRRLTADSSRGRPAGGRPAGGQATGKQNATARRKATGRPTSRGACEPGERAD